MCHLFFANSVNGEKTIDTIQEYCTASGQMVNYEKSNLIFSANIPRGVKQQFEAQLGIKVTGNPGSYLGIPNLWGKTRTAALGVSER